MANSSIAQSSIRLTVREDRFATITFDAQDRPTNVLTLDTWRDFEKTLKLLTGQTDIRGVILKSGKPNVFVAGADLKLLADAAPNDPRVREVIDLGNKVLFELEALPFPTCAIIDGAALGGGLEVALACDVILTGTNPKVELGLPEVKLGLMPGWGGTQRLPRVIGLPLAADAIGSGKTMNAVRATEIDLAIGPIDSDELLKSAMKVLKIDGWQAARRQKHEWVPAEVREKFRPQLANVPKAVREAVMAVVEGTALPLPSAVQLETDGFFRLVGSAESKKLIGEFFTRK
jgi:enoyl-CoA hydratase/carnithine racemase